MKTSLWASGVASLIAFTTLITPAAAQGRRPSDVPAGDPAPVRRVIDAATIEVILNNTPTLVRYLGVDAPVGDACYAAQAAAANKALVSGKLVRLEKDITDTDADGRLLRYVYVLDGRMASEQLLGAGLARATGVEPDIKHFGDLAVQEAQAMAAKRGGWARCGWSTQAVAPIENGCTVIAVERLMLNRSTLPELARVKSGDCVKIVKAINPSGAAWSGAYVFRPAGSTITPAAMYVRWKDSFMLISKESDGELYANVVRDSYKERVFPWQRAQYPDKVAGSTRVDQQKFVRDTADANVLVLPNPRTFLFRDLGNGQWQTLVDVFEYKSGDARVARYLPSGDVE